MFKVILDICMANIPGFISPTNKLRNEEKYIYINLFLFLLFDSFDTPML